MNNKEIILSKISKTLSKSYVIPKKQYKLKEALSCCGLKEYYKEYSNFLEPYIYDGNFENKNSRYSVFQGLDSIFNKLLKKEEFEKITELLRGLADLLNFYWIEKNMNEFEELSNLYNLFGLDLKVLEGRIRVDIYLGSNIERVEELFSVERWLQKEYPDVYRSYKGAIDSYTSGNFETSIGSCRTAYISMFGKYQGEGRRTFKGIFNFLGEGSDQEAGKALKEVEKKEIADFFGENINGKLTKTKTFYMFYCMMSDYGPHRNQNDKEVPTKYDALFILRIIDSIFFWMYEKQND